MQFELLAASLRADSRDMKSFVEALATKLEGALPGQTQVERRGGGFFSKEKRVHRIQVSMGEMRYELVTERNTVETRRAKAVRGIVLKTEQVPLEEWVDDLSRELADAARTNEQARLALEQLLER